MDLIKGLPEIQSLLNQVAIIVKKNNEILDATGGRFNVFNILGLSSDEVRLHSALLAELLKPNGSHGLKDEFLEEFVAKVIHKVKLNNQTKDNSNNVSVDNSVLFKFHSKTAIVEVEKSIGLVTDSEGGRIDIIITDKNKNAIIIENKIYASDQNAQLIRYDTYAKEKHLGKYKILYLTLNGIKASKGSAGEVIYERISYNEDILNWLQSCEKISVRQPLVRETINQYITIIKQLTGKDMSSVNKSDLINLITKNDNLESAFELLQGLNSTKTFLKQKFEEQIVQIGEELQVEVIGLRIIPKNWNNHFISFTYEDGGLNYGIQRKNIDNSRSKFIEIENFCGDTWKTSQGWSMYRLMYQNIENDPKFWIEINNGNAKENVKEFVKKIIDNFDNNNY